VWCVVCGVWCVVCGVWCVVCGVWCVVCGVWCVCVGVCVPVCARRVTMPCMSLTQPGKDIEGTRIVLMSKGDKDKMDFSVISAGTMPRWVPRDRRMPLCSHPPRLLLPPRVCVACAILCVARVCTCPPSLLLPPTLTSYVCVCVPLCVARVWSSGVVTTPSSPPPLPHAHRTPPLPLDLHVLSSRLYAAESTHKSSCALCRRWALFAKELEALYATFTKAGKAYTAKPQGAQPAELQRCDHPPIGRGWGTRVPGRGRVGVMGRGATTLRLEGVGAHGYLVGEELG
jgi:hypothetical protein